MSDDAEVKTEARREPNYAELRDQLDQLNRFLTSFFAVGNAIASIGDVNRVLEAKKAESDRLDGELAKRQADLDAVRRTQEAEASEHDAKVVAARDEAARIVRDAHERSADIDAQNKARRDQEQADHAASMDERRQALGDYVTEQKRTISNLDEQIEARRRVIDKKNGEIDETNARHAKVKRDIENLRSQAASLLGGESN